MTHVIFKYPLKFQITQVLDLPKGAEILTVQDQVGTLTLWARIPASLDGRYTEFSPFSVIIAPTGREVYDYGASYLTTVQQQEGKLVWHVFVKEGIVA